MKNPSLKKNLSKTTFGMIMSERSFSSEKYRYGFNGKEKTDEINGEGAVYDYGFRIYDSRLGRFLSVDPLSKEYPWNSSYAFAENDVIRCIDLEGCEKFLVTIIEYRDDGSAVLLLTLDPCKTLDEHKNGGLVLTLPDGTPANRTGDASLDDYLTRLEFDEDNKLKDKDDKLVCNSAPQSSGKSSQKAPCNGDKNAQDASLIYECQILLIAKTFNPTTIYKTCVVANPTVTTNASLNMNVPAGAAFVPSAATTYTYNVGTSTSNATVSVLFDAQSNSNDIIILDAFGNPLASDVDVTGSSNAYTFCVPANGTFTITVSPTGTAVSNNDAWALSVSVITTSNVTTPDGGAGDPCPATPPCTTR